MALHQTTEHHDNSIEDIYASGASERCLPKYRLPDQSTEASTAYSLVHDELMLDGNSRQNLATFCTTWVEPQVQKLMAEALDKNMIDKDEYPQTAELENRCVHILADLWHAQQSWETVGCSTTGSSEAAMLGGLAFKWKWRKRREAEGKDASKPNIVTGPVQICWLKFARYFDVEIREVPLEGDALGLKPEDLRRYCDENTIGVVATLGVTFTGIYEPVEALARELDAMQRDLGLDIPIHVDAASGGFIAPFIQRDLVWDFQIERVRSINASGHKYGLAPLGVGWVIWASKKDLPEELIFNVDYLGGNMPCMTCPRGCGCGVGRSLPIRCH
jgi:glutamate decarboxylase